MYVSFQSLLTGFLLRIVISSFVSPTVFPSPLRALNYTALSPNSSLWAFPFLRIFNPWCSAAEHLPLVVSVTAGAKILSFIKSQVSFDVCPPYPRHRPPAAGLTLFEGQRCPATLESLDDLIYPWESYIISESR